MTIDIDKLRAAHAATTQGEWMGVDLHDNAPYLVADQGKEWCNPLIANFHEDVTPEDSVTFGNWYEATPNAVRNICFIALAHNEFPAMLDEIERLRTLLSRTIEVFNDACNCGECGPCKLREETEGELK